MFLNAALLSAVLVGGLSEAEAGQVDAAAIQAHLSTTCAWPTEDPIPNRRLVKIVKPPDSPSGLLTGNLLEIYRDSWVFRGQEVNGARGLAEALDQDEEAEAEKGVTLGSGAAEEGTAVVRIGGGVRGRTVARAARVLSARGLRDVTFVGAGLPGAPQAQAPAQLPGAPGGRRAGLPGRRCGALQVPP